MSKKKPFFNESIAVRLVKDDEKNIDFILGKDVEDRYDNKSHFIRCAIRKLIREELHRLSFNTFNEKNKKIWRK